MENISQSEKAAIMEEVKQNIAIANANDLLTKMTEKCFSKCINKPGVSLDSSEQKCISMCMDRFMDSLNLISRTYTKHLQNQSNRM